MMSIEVTDLLKVDKLLREPATKTLVEAFQTYPLVQQFYSDEIQRDRVTNFFLSISVYSGIQYGEVYTTSSNFEGVAIWMPPGTYPLSFWRGLRAVPLSALFGFFRYGGGKIRVVGEHIDSVHQRLAPFEHWFLQTIGVAPQFQGKGYAGMLLRAILAQIDKEGLPSYLETLDEHNVEFYEYFGFKVVDKSPIPGTSLTSWAMLRESL